MSKLPLINCSGSVCGTLAHHWVISWVIGYIRIEAKYIPRAKLENTAWSTEFFNDNGDNGSAQNSSRIVSFKNLKILLVTRAVISRILITIEWGEKLKIKDKYQLILTLHAIIIMNPVFSCLHCKLCWVLSLFRSSSQTNRSISVLFTFA